MNQAESGDRWLKPAEAARLLGKSMRTLGRWADDGELQMVRTRGGHRRFSERAVLRLARTYGDCLSAEEVAKLLNIHPRNVHRRARQGKLPFIRMAKGQRLYPKAEILKIVESRKPTARKDR